jgi:hypothetical protein
MKTHRIIALVLAAAVLAVVSTSFASAMVPKAQLSSGPVAEWVTTPSNYNSAPVSGSFDETCAWKQNLYIGYQLDGIYCYRSIYTAQQYNQINHPYILSQYGQTVEQSSNVPVYSTPVTNGAYNLCLGFWVNDPQLHNYFTSTVGEYITVY